MSEFKIEIEQIAGQYFIARIFSIFYNEKLVASINLTLEINSNELDGHIVLFHLNSNIKTIAIELKQPKVKGLWHSGVTLDYNTAIKSLIYENTAKYFSPI